MAAQKKELEQNAVFLQEYSENQAYLMKNNDSHNAEFVQIGRAHV